DLHVFRFSPRPGTAAAEWGDLPGPAECARRSRQLLELAADKKADFIRASVGGVERVLVEERVGERWEGLTDTYVRVVLDDDGLEAGQLVTVRIVGAAQEAAQGKVVCRDVWGAATPRSPARAPHGSDSLRH
ncbi:MAG: hypothetical protein NUV35_07385, partial [Syntrophomonadaceae bacterium]|nr:hypothetical protein [Syntrophomonadaceae bacterium]